MINFVKWKINLEIKFPEFPYFMEEIGLERVRSFHDSLLLELCKNNYFVSPSINVSYMIHNLFELPHNEIYRKSQRYAELYTITITIKLETHSLTHKRWATRSTDRGFSDANSGYYTPVACTCLTIDSVLQRFASSIWQTHSSFV